MTEKQWKITATVDTALCIGDSGVSEIGADKSTVKTSDGKLYVPASTLKGIWRHACEAIAPSMGDYCICRSPRAENMCPQHPETEDNQDEFCIICQIFGSPKIASIIFINDLTMDTELATESTEIRNGVTINRQRPRCRRPTPLFYRDEPDKRRHYIFWRCHPWLQRHRQANRAAACRSQLYPCDRDGENPRSRLAPDNP